jgi:outer membrane protein assembly factor BamD (BamD/ComL family)
MYRWTFRWVAVVVLLLAFPCSSPAPLIYTPGEGWTYETPGTQGKWQRTRAKDQLEVAEKAFEARQYSLALKAARRTVRVWPLSDYAPRARYLAGRCYQAKGNDEKAFKEYQKIVEKSPKLENYDEISQRQFEIAGKYLAGKWFKLWGVIPFFPSMDKTAEMYTQIVNSGPFSEVAPQAQLKIGAAREKQSNYAMAVKAYELAADRYHDRPQVAAQALYRQAKAYKKQAQTADYDQTSAGQAISVYTDFMTLYPDDSRVEKAQKTITDLKAEQARGSFRTAKFYEKYHRYNGALIYYNEVTLQDPNSPYANEAKERIDALKKQIEQTPAK